MVEVKVVYGAEHLKQACLHWFGWYNYSMRIGLLLVLLTACTKDKLPDLYLLQGACEVQVKSDIKDSDIYLDGILVGHGEASTKIPCGEKKIQVIAKGKWEIEEYKVVTLKSALELDYKMKNISEVKNWAMSPELIAQLKKGQGTLDISDPEYKNILAARLKERTEQGYAYTPQELAAAAKKLAGGDAGADDAGGAIKIDPSTNFDDVKTWM